MGLVAVVVTRLPDRDLHTLLMAVLVVVGLHFLILGVARGPLIAVLGVLTTLNAALGMRDHSVPLPVVGVVDAVLNVGFGVWMLAFYPAVTYT